VLAFWQRITTSTASPARSRNLVVVGLPSGEELDRVGEVAADFAAATGADLCVVATQRFLLEDREELAARVATVAGGLEERGLNVETHVGRGDLAATLLDEATRTGAQVIVVDGSEPDGSTALLSSAWDHVAHHAPCNVLVAR
jgi:nucleotide-binding universal stress UspA family protein